MQSSQPDRSRFGALKPAVVLWVLAGAVIMTGSLNMAAYMVTNPSEFTPEQVAEFLSVGALGNLRLGGWRSEFLLLSLGGVALWLSGISRMCSPRVRSWILWGVMVLSVAAATAVADLVRLGIMLPGAELVSIGPLAIPTMTAAKAGLLVMIVLAAGLGNRLETLGQDTPDHPSFPISQYLAIGAQLGLLTLAVQLYSLESSAFHERIMPLVFAGFLVHAALPLQLRPVFFLLLSLAGILGVFGVQNGACLIGIGLGLIGICHLPLTLPIRVAMLVLAAAGLGALRAGWWSTDLPSVIWPILGSMFMFRLIVYLYDLKHGKVPTTFVSTLSYFFLLPNIVFPLFPVVDYQAFRRNYYDADRFDVYQVGLRWILRGFVHLLLYRLIYFYLVIGPEEVTTAGDLVRYMVSNFLLILRLSGQFHLAVGILRLFGFNLPPTMNRYWLASSFTDFWRRANIYWKDFMQKVVFYPLCFRLRAWDLVPRMVFATVIVFGLTWFLHAYQWFWLRGSFLLAGPDIAFWSLFAALVTANTYQEARRGRQRVLGKPAWSLRQAGDRALRVAATFTVICVLWSIWISTSLSEWFSLWTVVRVPEVDRLSLLTIGLGAGVVVAQAARNPQGQNPRPETKPAGSGRARLVAMTAIPLIVLYVAAQPSVSSQFGTDTSGFIQGLRTDRLNKRDQALLHRGYYENLSRVDRFNPELWNVYHQRNQDWRPLWKTGSTMDTGDYLKKELRPNVLLVFKGEPFHTNRWGMRDKDYEKSPPPNTCRIALLGGSYEMAPGIPEGQSLEALLEDRLNRANDGMAWEQYEILNFAVAAYAPVRRMMSLERKAFDFQPDVVFYTGHPTDGAKAIAHLVARTRSGVEPPYEFLLNLLREEGVHQDMSVREAKTRLFHRGNDLVAWVYRRIVEQCRERGILPVHILYPLVEREDPGQLADHRRMALEAGFVLLDLSDVFDGEDLDSLRLAEWDDHMGARAHRLVADRIYQELTNRQVLAQLARTNSTTKEIHGRHQSAD